MIINSTLVPDSHSGASAEISIYSVSEHTLNYGPGSRLALFLQGCNVGCIWCHAPHSQGKRAPILYRDAQCSGCMRCAAACENGVHVFTQAPSGGKRHKLERSRCTHCGKCISACPQSDALGQTGALSLPTKTLSVQSLFTQIEPYLASCDGVTLGGGEALLQLDACVQLLSLLKENNVHTAVETSGLIDKRSYEKVAPYVDTWLFGIRTDIDEYASTNYTKLVENAQYIASTGKEIMPRVTIIPNVSNRADVLSKACATLNLLGEKDVWLNKWSSSYALYYDACGIPLKFKKPSEKAIKTTTKEVLTFFNAHGYNILNP